MRGYAFLILGFSVAETIVHSVFPAAAERWFEFARPVTDFLGSYIVAVGQLTALVAGTSLADRAPVLTNFICISWLITVPATVLGIVAALLDLYANPPAARAIIDRLWNADRDPGLVIMVYLVIAVGLFAVLFTSIAYVEAYRSYTTDLSFPMLAYLFYGFAVCCVLLVSVAVASKKVGNSDGDETPA